MTEYKSFEEMPVWQKAHKLAVEIFHVSEHFPRKEDYGLTSQLRRAALSIPANIAEAFGRFHYKDKLNFYYNSRGSANETKSHLLYARDVSYIDVSIYDALDHKLSEVLLELNSVISTLRRNLKS
jgi:four helix bundle protein